MFILELYSSNILNLFNNIFQDFYYEANVPPKNAIEKISPSNSTDETSLLNNAAEMLASNVVNGASNILNKVPQSNIMDQVPQLHVEDDQQLTTAEELIQTDAGSH